MIGEKTKKSGKYTKRMRKQKSRIRRHISGHPFPSLFILTLFEGHLLLVLLLGLLVLIVVVQQLVVVLDHLTHQLAEVEAMVSFVYVLDEQHLQVGLVLML